MYSVRASRISGLGLFATEPIPRGTVIGRVEGVPTDRDGPHVLWIGGEEGLEVTNSMRYLNHSDTPNAVYYDDLTVVALRDIAAGEEITHDYRGDHDDVEMDFAAAEE